MAKKSYRLRCIAGKDRNQSKQMYRLVSDSPLGITCIQFKSHCTCLEKRIEQEVHYLSSLLGNSSTAMVSDSFHLDLSKRVFFSQPQELAAIGSNGVEVALSQKALDGGEYRFPSSVLQQHSHQCLYLLGKFVDTRTPPSLLSSHDISIFGNGHPIMKLCVQQRQS